MPTENADSRLFAAIEQGSVLVALFDPDDRLMRANRAYEEAFLRGLAKPVQFADILRHGFRNGFGVQIDCGDVEQFLADILPRRRAQPSRTIVSDLVDGRWLLINQTLLDDGWMLDVMTDISQLKHHEIRITQMHASALQAALTDPLTGASNRRHILELAATALEAFERDRVAACFALLDMDHFKQINDTHGHAAGVDVLVQFCALARVHLRPVDSLGRVGGEEFLLVLRDVTTAEAEGILERLRKAMRELEPVRPTFSAGITQPVGGESLEALLRRADAALYAAKAAGRNRSVVAGPGYGGATAADAAPDAGSLSARSRAAGDLPPPR
jgi:diguanylate cyclase (GGDEF)-like protein